MYIHLNVANIKAKYQLINLDIHCKMVITPKAQYTQIHIMKIKITYNSRLFDTVRHFGGKLWPDDTYIHILFTTS